MLNEDEIDALLEMLNLGVGQAAALLGDLLQEHIQLSVPSLSLVPDAKMCTQTLAKESWTEPVACVETRFSDLLRGSCLLIFTNHDALRLVREVCDEEEEVTHLDATSIETLTEVGNIVINGVIGTLANALQMDERLEVLLPEYRESCVQEIQFNEQDIALLLKVDLKTDALQIQAAIVICLSIQSLDPLIAMLRDQIDGD